MNNPQPACHAFPNLASVPQRHGLRLVRPHRPADIISIIILNVFHSSRYDLSRAIDELLFTDENGQQPQTKAPHGSGNAAMNFQSIMRIGLRVRRGG